MRIVTILVFPICLLFPAGTALAAGPLDIDVEASVVNSYQWRGSPFNEDSVFQPSITVGFGGVSLNLWGNMDLTEYKDKRYSVSELDYTLTWARSLPFGELTSGAATYSYPGVEGEETTTELMVGLEADLPIAPSLTLFKDIDKADGLYVLVGAEGSVPFGSLASFDVSASLGWGSEKHNIYYYGIPDMNGTFTDAAVTIGVPLGIGETMSIAPHASYILRIDKKMRASFDTGCFVFGLTVAGAF